MKIIAYNKIFFFKHYTKKKIFILLSIASVLLFLMSLIYFVFENIAYKEQLLSYGLVNTKHSDLLAITEKYYLSDNSLQSNKELTAKTTFFENFTAKNSNLEGISILFNTFNRINSGQIIFRIKEKNDKQWYFQSTKNANQFQNNIPFLFEIPVIKNSKNVKYTFTLESLTGRLGNVVSVASSHYIMIRYIYSKSALKDLQQFVQFIRDKIAEQIPFITITELITIFICLISPFLLYGIITFKLYLITICRRFNYIIYGLFTGIIIFYLIFHYGNIQFPGMDGSISIDAGWRYYLGQEMYKDLITIVPPGYLFGTKLSFILFGVSWKSQLLFLTIFSICTFLLQTYIFIRFGMSICKSYLLAFFIQLVTTVLTTFWWYNSITTVSATLFISSSVVFYKNPKSSINTILFFFTTCLLALMKINTAGFLLLSVYFIFLFIKMVRVKSIIVGLSSLIYLILFLYFIQINPLTLFHAYTSGTNRLNYFISEITWINPFVSEAYQTLLFFTPFLFGCIMLADYIFSNKLAMVIYRRYKVYLVFCLIGFINSILAFGTNTELRVVDLPVLYITVLLFVTILHIDGKKKKTHDTLNISKIFYLMISSVVLLSVNAVVMTVQRDRVKASNDFYQPLLVKKVTNRNKLFNDLYATPYFLNTLDSISILMTTVKKTTPNLDYKIYFGPRIIFGYSMYNIKPAKGFPLWWGEEFNGIPRGTTDFYVKRFKKSDFSMIVTVLGDLTYHPPEIKMYLDQSYNFYRVGDLILWVNPRNAKLDHAVKLLTSVK